MTRQSANQCLDIFLSDINVPSDEVFILYQDMSQIAQLCMQLYRHIIVEYLTFTKIVP